MFLSGFLDVSLDEKTLMEYGSPPVGTKEIDGLLAHPDIAYTLLTDYLITG